MTISTSKLDKRIERDIQGCYILGRLPDELDPSNIPPLGKERKPVTLKHGDDNTIVYYLQAVSDEPNPLKNILGKNEKECYVSFGDRYSSYLQKIKYGEKEDKVNFLLEHFTNKLILFKPKLTVNKGIDNQERPYHYNFEIVMAWDDSNKNRFFKSIPHVKKGVPSIQFEKALFGKKPIELPEYPNLMDIPEFIMCENTLYFIPYQDILEAGLNSTLYYGNQPDKILKLSIDEIDSFWDKIQGTFRDISFITDSYASDLRDIFHLKGEPLSEDGKIKKESSFSSEFVLNNNEWHEADFIDRLKYLAEKEELYYDEVEALINFHTALKTGNISVLGGMSGTGKTRLALLYAKALGLEEDKNLLIVPISPSYTEPSDILGYLNPQLGLFMESETGLITFLEKANHSESVNKLFMVLFDEMNLGQVEHYFAPFISLMELPKSQRILYPISKNSICHNKNLSNGIFIRDNVLFVGTANFDETTKDFSNRMLDRMNVIFLEKVAFKKVFIERNIENLNENEDMLISRNLYRDEWNKEKTELEEREIALLDKLHDNLSDFDSQLGVSFRTANAIRQYLSNLPKDKENNLLITREAALDFQIKQRILTKIRGHREQIEELVGTFDLKNNKYEPGIISELLMGEEEKEKFNSSLEFLKQKAKEVSRNGYAL